MEDIVPYQPAQFGFLGVSAGNVFGSEGSAFLVCFGMRLLLRVLRLGAGRCEPWIGLISYPSEAVEQVPRLPKFSGQISCIVRTGHEI